MAPAHVPYEPEWVIDSRGDGSFRVECSCGWQSGGFDTITRARAAGFDHSTGAPPASGDLSSGEPTRRRRFWRR